MPSIDPYMCSVIVMGLMALLMLIQLIVADVVALKAGHPPGYAISDNHSSFIFRASRSIANSNESVAIFILGVGFAIAMGAAPGLVNGGAVAYFVGRLAHMTFYYLNIPLLRSASFVVSLLGLLVILISGFKALL